MRELIIPIRHNCSAKCRGGRRTPPYAFTEHDVPGLNQQFALATCNAARFGVAGGVCWQNQAAEPTRPRVVSRIRTAKLVAATGDDFSNLEIIDQIRTRQDEFDTEPCRFTGPA